MGAVNYEPIPIQDELEMRNNSREENKELYIQIDELLEAQRSASEKADALRNSIFKVPKHLYKKNIDEKLYEPQVVSIGPYHRAKAHLKAMEVNKTLYLDQLLKRTKEDTVQSYVEELKKREKMARECYAAPVDNISHDEFVKMMLLDGCFIIEVIRYDQVKELKNSHPLTNFTVERVKRDLMLLENQLPFFILWDLFFLTRTPWDKGESFISMATKFFSQTSPGLGIHLDPKHSKHLLGLLHDIWFPTEVKDIMTAETEDDFPKSDPEKWRNLRKDRTWQFIPSATQFKVAGIEFVKETGQDLSKLKDKAELEKLDHRGNNWLFHITFENGVMRIPVLKIDDDTESVFGNLLAYEQGYNCQNTSSKLVTDYIILMDCLVSSAKDVELLCNRGVIVDWFGDHEEVASMFNRLGQSLLICKGDFFYTEMFMKVNSRRGKTLNRWIAILRQNYFNTPWAWISFSAALILLVLTMIQTMYTVG